MEKYPHRINFAKGILESRKQHYRHLKLVLRALPLHTSTELELGPKSKVRVTLIDANHCPGAVMFLIEDDSNAILYTGDVRAEPWWVNSIMQSPFLLPYSCNLKHLDCLYLDTTFSTSNHAYRHFQTKQEGLRELLEKVSSFPSDTHFYLRAWTLGYEDVWIALSNLLDCRVHVSDYQLNLFSGIVEDGRDGYSMFEGPALMGFPVGNQTQSGCLSASSKTRLHSCEPGMECHTKLKESNIVYITPTIARLPDGSELLEIGAGGGFEDLNQTPELEMADAQTIEAFRTLCRETVKDEEALKNVNQSIQAMLNSGSSKISLDGLGLDAKEEVSLKDFAHLISKTASLPEPGPNGEENVRKQSPHNAGKDRVIRFPYSRHSSYEELRQLVSVFRPKDICPCTVDLDTWDTNMTMENLFGDLCSEVIFYHDKEIDVEAAERRRIQEISNSRKRKRQDDSQDIRVQDGYSQPDEFTSARESIGIESVAQKGRRDGSVTTQNADRNSLSQRPLLDPEAANAGSSHLDDAARKDIRVVFHALNNGSDLITKDVPQPDGGHNVPNEGPESQQSDSLSAFDSQTVLDDVKSVPQVDGMFDSSSVAETKQLEGSKRTRRLLRRDAHSAATRALWQNESGEWDDLNLRCVGRADHSKGEVEL